MNPTDEQQPPAPAPLADSNVAPHTPARPTSGKRKKPVGKIAVVVGAAVVLLGGGGAAAYVGFIAPNQPERIWEASLTNTAKGYDKLVEYGDEQSDAKGSKVKGTFKVNTPDLVVDGTVNAAYDPKNTNLKLAVGAAGTRVSLTAMTHIPEGASTPDLYVKAEGLTDVGTLVGAGDPAIADYLASLDNKYYFIDHTLFDHYTNAAQADPSSIPELTVEDSKAIAEAIGRVNREYLFTTDKHKAVLTVKSNQGKETRDGREVYHFKVGYDKKHLKSYVAELKEELQQIKIKTVVEDNTYNDLLKEINSLSGKGQADVWVDMKTKLIRTVRFTDDQDKSTFDVGVLYEGGDNYPFMLAVKQGKNAATMKFNLNTKTNIVTLTADGAFGENDQSVSFKASFTVEPSNEAVEFTKPAGAESLSDLIAPFLESAQSALELTEGAQDVEIAPVR